MRLVELSRRVALWLGAAAVVAPPASRAAGADTPKLPADAVRATLFLTVRDVAVSRDYYVRVFGAEPVRADLPAVVRLANTWLILNVGGGPTPDKPDVVLAAPGDPTQASCFMNLRVGDIAARYAEWRARGAEFLTPPIRGVEEIRCYIRDPDGYLIEVGQTI